VFVAPGASIQRRAISGVQSPAALVASVGPMFDEDPHAVTVTSKMMAAFMRRTIRAIHPALRGR
jgi:hypothetical protein